MFECICTECGQPCECVEVNVGIGFYEYWGEMCNDVDMQIRSKCCLAEVNDPLEEKVK